VLDRRKKNSLFFPQEIKTKASADTVVAILLCTYNGARFLAEQLESIEAQIHQQWFVVASDDGSSDTTLEVLRQYQAKWPPGKLLVRNGPQQGFCLNFLSLACDPTISADFYAFCDQDDVWLPSKLSTALNTVHPNYSDNVPYLYCGRTTYVDESLRKIGASKTFKFPRTFRNALVQSIAGGNTMVFNSKTKELLEKIGIVQHTSHDWWLYQLVAGVGGLVHYDEVPQVLYRQHSESLVGENTSMLKKVERVSVVIKGQFRRWCDVNDSAFSRAESFLTNDNKVTLDFFRLMRAARFKDRLRLFEVVGLYRQTWQGTASLFLAILLNKV